MNQNLKKFIKSILPQKVTQKIQQYRFQRMASHFRAYCIKKRLGDTEFDFLIGDIVGKQWYDTDVVGNTYEMCFIRDKMIHAGDIIFECGSHHGYTTLLLSDWVGKKGKIFAFEASKHNYAILQKNITLNAITNIIAYNMAVGDKRGDAHLSIDYNVNIVKHSSGNPVKMINLDAFKENAPDLIKIDVEGFEGAVLQGAYEILRSHPKLVIELHTELLCQYNLSVKDIFNFIERDAYNIWIQWANHEKPQPYKNEEILHRVHLFCLPR